MFLASTGYDYTVKIWDVCSLMLRQTLEEHTKYVYCVAFSRDSGELLASGRAWMLRSSSGTWTWNAEEDPDGKLWAVFSVALSQIGDILAGWRRGHTQSLGTRALDAEKRYRSGTSSNGVDSVQASTRMA